MRILILSTFFPPQNSIASLRPYSWAKYWVEEGEEVTVITTKKDVDPETSLKIEPRNFQVIEVPLPKFLSGLKTRYRVSTGKTKSGFCKNLFNNLRHKKGIFNACRMPDITDFWVGAAFRRASSLGKFDIVVSSCGPYSVHLIGYKLKIRGFCKNWVADFRDLWTDNHIFRGLFPFNIIEKAREKKILRHADAITTIGSRYAMPLVDKYGSDRVRVVENGFDPADFNTLPQIPLFFDDGRFRLVYTGSFYPGNQNVDPLFMAIDALRHEDGNLVEKLEVIFVGPPSRALDNLIEYYSLQNIVHHFGFVSRETALRMQRDAHCLLFLPDYKSQGVYTGKLFEYLYSGTPIIAVGGKGMETAQELILKEGAGKAFFDVAGLKDYLKHKLKFPAKEKSGVSRESLQRFNRKQLAGKFLEIIYEIRMRRNNSYAQ